MTRTVCLGAKAVAPAVGKTASRPALPQRKSSLRPRKARQSHVRSAWKPEDDFESGNLKELQDDIDLFLKQKNQDDAAAAERDPDMIIGADVVSDEEARDYCQRVIKVLKKLQTNRRMGLSEVQLTIEIEQPEEIERNKVLGIDDMPSREERALALTRVTSGKIPENRLALKVLCDELEAWPYLEEAIGEPQGGVSQYEQLASGGGGWGPPKRKMGRDPNEAPTGVLDMLPDWVGYSALYLVSAVPVIITVSVIAILFFSSLK